MIKTRAFVVTFAAVLAASGEARADLSSWYSVGFGVSRLQAAGVDAHWRYNLPFDVGMGSPPSLPIVVGLGVRLTPYFADGFDYATYARVAMRSYVTGGFGLAVDGGGFFRTFYPGSTGFMTTLNVGLPWGFIVSGTYEGGTNDSKTMSATLGIDFLRLTVYRLANESQWPNVNPAWRPQPEAPPPKP